MMHPYRLLILLAWAAFGGLSTTQAQPARPALRQAPAPLFRDPIYDGAADPVLIWNREEQAWWMLYTARRANQDGPGVSYCFGTDIGIASSADEGQTWTYRGSLDLEFERGRNTFWAPDVVYHNGTYHLFVAYLPGVRSEWGGVAHIVQYTSPNLWDWTYKGPLHLSSDNVIDATLMQMPDQQWHIWYKDQGNGSITMTATSPDLEHWQVADGPAIGGGSHEGPKAFRFQGWYWMLTDEWKGMRVYRSKDAKTWEKQGLILDGPSDRPEDTPSGAHGDVVVLGDRAYVFYFTHPGRKTHFEGERNADNVYPYTKRRSSIQVAPLTLENGTLVSDRSRPFDFWLSDPTRP
ncbi:family 43 glycosylhydrolase [Catalinimonas alkaloidigena]|nr:family 43 glycosylhydrolase [Catalinimonas alkaloidigena]